MVKNTTRSDPYKNFKFRVVFGAAVVGLAGYLLKRAFVRSDGGGVRRNAYRRPFGMERLPRTAARWEDLALPPDQLEALRSLAADARRRKQVNDRSRSGKAGEGPIGVTALFSGASGTGKLMAAQLLANGLG